MACTLRNTVLCFSAVFVVSTCGWFGSRTANGPLPYSYTEIDEVFGNCDDSLCYQISLNYPVFQGDSLDDIQEKVLEDFMFWQQAGSSTNTIPELLKDQEEVYKDMADNGFDTPSAMYLTASLNVDFNDKGILSYTVSRDAFTGGAHPLYEARLMAYFVDNGIKPISWTDVFIADSLSRFENLAKLTFFNFHALDMNESANDQGFWFESGDFTLNESFSIQPDGISILYNNYEVASYAVGPTSLFIKWEEVKPWLTPRFKEVFK